MVALVNLLAAILHPLLMTVTNWQQALLSNEAPEPFQSMEHIWMLIKGITFSAIWIFRNNSTFNHKSWTTFIGHQHGMARYDGLCSNRLG